MGQWTYGFFKLGLALHPHRLSLDGLFVPDQAFLHFLADAVFQVLDIALRSWGHEFPARPCKQSQLDQSFPRAAVGKETCQYMTNVSPMSLEPDSKGAQRMMQGNKKQPCALPTSSPGSV